MAASDMAVPPAQATQDRRRARRRGSLSVRCGQWHRYYGKFSPEYPYSFLPSPLGVEGVGVRGHVFLPWIDSTPHPGPLPQGEREKENPEASSRQEPTDELAEIASRCVLWLHLPPVRHVGAV